MGILLQFGYGLKDHGTGGVIFHSRRGVVGIAAGARRKVDQL